jgi:hypothetical protein
MIREITIRFVLSAFALLALAGFAQASDDSVLPDRRKPQFQTDFGYAIFPYPYSLPGIGTGISLIGAAMNIADTYTDAYGILFTGDVRGGAVGVRDIHIVPRTLILEAGFGTLSKVTIQSYGQRGMNTDKNDFRLLELTDTEYYGARMTATFFDRRFEIYGAMYAGSSKLESIRDKDGNVIVDAQDPPRTYGHTTLFGTRLDLTDDYADPRRGLRVDVTRTQSPPRGSSADYYVMDYNTTAYLPLGRRSTWVFNFLRSDAVVVSQGETDPAKLQQQQGLNCSDPSLTLQQQQFCLDVINSMVAENTYGTATSLGGFSRLRSYPQGRYKGAHTLFYGTEVRWNLTDESTPFNIIIMKDIRTAVQVSLFYENGSVADLRSELGKIWRDSYGMGLRIVTASGVVLRGDLAFGREGANTAVFIGYPWEI